MDSCRAIVKQLGEPTKRWPKHQGYLRNAGRFKLVSFLVANGAPRAIIAKLADSTQIGVRGRARKDWECLVGGKHDIEAYRTRTSAYKLDVGAVYLNGALKEAPALPAPSAPSAPAVVVALLNLR